LRSRGVPCLVLAEARDGVTPAEGLLPWNPPSLLSAHTAMLEAKTRYGGVDAAVLAFDADSFARSVNRDGGDVSSVIDRLVTGWIYLEESLRERFAAAGKGYFCFVHSVPAAKGTPSPASLPLAVALAESAFVRLAEETAARNGDGIRSLLVRYENGGDETALEWLASRIADGPPQRSQTRWVKAGSKGLFGLL